MRRALGAASAAVVLLAGLVGLVPLAGSGVAYAAECPAFTPGEAVAASDEVFHGRVTGAPTAARGGRVLTYPVAVQVPFKGRVSGAVEVHLRAGPCRGARLDADEDYFFFLDRAAGGRLVGVGTATSVTAYTESLNQELHEIAGTGGGTTEQVSFGEAASTEPRSFSRLAAPGAALLIVGLLGLLLVRRRGRRTA